MKQFKKKFVKYFYLIIKNRLKNGQVYQVGPIAKSAQPGVQCCPAYYCWIQC